jgi:hypothetical protein
VGEAYDCVNVPGGLSLPGTPCDDGDPLTANEVWNTNCDCVGIPVDCAGVINGIAFVDGCGVCAGGTTGIMPNPDTDDDGILDCADLCPELFDPVQGDLDEDGVGDLCDNCPWNSNPGQEDDNGNGVGNVCDEVGIEDLRGMEAFVMHPNPTRGLVRFAQPVAEARDVIVMDALGSLVLRVPFSEVIDLGTLAPGTYMVLVQGGSGELLGKGRIVRL